MGRGRLMIVEDERIVALDLEDRLRRMGFEVVGSFGRGEEALANVQRLGPELALMDIRLAGELDGIATARVLREDHAVPVVFLTAYADDATLERLKVTEPLGYVLKPFEERALQATVETALFRHRAEQARAEAEAARRRAEARYYAALDNSPDAIISVDAAGQVVVFNHAAERMFGYSADEARGLPLARLLPEAYRARHLEHVEAFRRNERRARTMGQPRAHGPPRAHPLGSGLRRDGTTFPIEATISSIDDEEPMVTAVVRDVTERLALEDKLRRAEQREAMGMLAASVIHDVNNLLAVIQNAAELVAREPGAPCRSPYLGTIEDAVARGAALTRQLLLFAARGPAPGAAPVDQTLSQLGPIMRHMTPESIRLELALNAAHACVGFDQHRLEQVILNCVANARDAMPAGGTITVRTAVDGETVLISVGDTGLGIPAHVLPRVFEPFFTTKDSSRGTGLGLWSVREVVEGAAGTIDIASEVGAGTTVTIRLPCTDAPEPLIRPAVVGSAPTRERTATVLIVDDEEPLRRILSRLLELHGFRTFTASGAGEALALLEQEATRFDVLVADIGLPIMGGRELAERMRRFLPNLRVLFVSGYADSLSGLPPAGTEPRVLAKPFAGHELVGAIDELLAAGAR